jgi:hypothetical protein
LGKNEKQRDMEIGEMEVPKHEKYKKTTMQVPPDWPPVGTVYISKLN